MEQTLTREAQLESILFISGEPVSYKQLEKVLDISRDELLATIEGLSARYRKAQLEVLAIISYRGPISRTEIEAIRGVNCSYTLRALLLRELIERDGNPENLRGYVYTLSNQFLLSLGVSSPVELPDFEQLSQDKRLTEVIAAELPVNPDEAKTL